MLVREGSGPRRTIHEEAAAEIANWIFKQGIEDCPDTFFGLFVRNVVESKEKEDVEAQRLFGFLTNACTNLPTLA